MYRMISMLVSALSMPLTALAEMPELIVGAENQTALAVTVYKRDLALVHDTRDARLPPGVYRLAFTGVSAQIRAETAQLHGGLEVLEQNFDYDLLSPRKLLEKYVGHDIGRVHVNPATGEETVQEGTLLSIGDGGMVIRFGEHIETDMQGGGRFVFSDIPSDLRERPTLTMLAENTGDTKDALILTYLTGGLSWNADYVATVKENGDTMDLTGWVTVTNNSGVDYRDAQLRLMAGDVRQLPDPRQEQVRSRTLEISAAAPVQPTSAFEYHLYTLPRPTTLADRQAKQLPLIHAREVPVARQYRINASPPYYGPNIAEQNLQVDVVLRFKNDKSLGEPLPAGVMRFYQRGSDGAAQFIGENALDHTPEGRGVSLDVGSAFDLTATRRQVDFRKVFGDERESSWEITLHNAKSEPAEVTVVADFPGEWRMVRESLPHEREDADTARWTVAVPAKGQSTLSYQVLLR